MYLISVRNFFDWLPMHTKQNNNPVFGLTVIKSNAKFLALMGIAWFITTIDILSKNWIFEMLTTYALDSNAAYAMIMVFPGLNLIAIHNRGITFGMLDNLTHGRILISLFTSLMIACLIYLMYQRRSFLRQRLGLCFVIGGALGNLYDRVRFGVVRDFVDLYVGNYHWPAFNFADSMICIGVVIFLISDFIDQKKCFKSKVYRND